ncbi:MAG: pyridoxal-phosphate dependent enzyme, partial [Bacteroidota bacterium]
MILETKPAISTVSFDEITVKSSPVNCPMNLAGYFYIKLKTMSNFDPIPPAKPGVAGTYDYFSVNGYPGRESKLENKFRHFWRLIGNTPMLEILYRYKGECRKVYVKCEHYNLTGSIKDRMALYILQMAYIQGDIKPGDIIVEATSGNTGISFSAIGRALGHDVKIIMPDWLSKERIDIINSLGAEEILISREEGGFLGSIALSEKMAREDSHVFLPKQFENCFNAEAHEKTTAREIWMQLQSVDITPDA